MSTKLWILLGLSALGYMYIREHYCSGCECGGCDHEQQRPATIQDPDPTKLIFTEPSKPAKENISIIQPMSMAWF